MPRGSGRAAAGDLGLLPQGEGRQEPRGHFLDRGASECFNSLIDTFPVTKPYYGELQTYKKTGYNELPGTHHPASAVINSDQVSLFFPWGGHVLVCGDNHGLNFMS